MLNNKFDFSDEKFPLLLDGAMGTMLQAAGLPPGECPEVYCITEPEKVKSIHKAYLMAGSRIIYANTFGANSHKLAKSGYSPADVIAAAVKIAKEAVSEAQKELPENEKMYVALDIGPIGEMLEPYGTLTFEDAYEVFKNMILCGAEAGADIVVFETMTDLYEVKSAVLAAKENCDLPVLVTMSFEQSGRTFTGTSIESMACLLEGLQVDAVGINCSLGPEEIFPLACRLKESTTLPLIIKANAGLPDPSTGFYDISAGSFADIMKKYSRLDLCLVGGCCGTTPDYISALKKSFHSDYADKKGAGLSGDGIIQQNEVETGVPCCEVIDNEETGVSRICTPTQLVEIDRVRIIGERINPTGKKRFKQALIEKDFDYILNEGIKQMEAGADILDVNVGLPEIDEPSMMAAVIKKLQAVVDIPLQIDSSDPLAIEAGLRVCNGKPIVNSVNGKDSVLNTILPLVKKYGAAVVGLCLDEDGIKASAAERFEIAEKIVNRALSYGISRNDIFIDCLTLTVSAQQAEAAETLKAVQMVREKLGVHAVLGVSNISFGLPDRELINKTFLTLAMGQGLDLPIINPNNKAMMDAVGAFNVIFNVDKNCSEYIEKHALKENPGTLISAQPANGDSAVVKIVHDDANAANDSRSASGNTAPNATQMIKHAIERGLQSEAAQAVKTMLETKKENQIINDDIIPALDDVGKKFEAGRLFLPQLLNSAAAASAAFDVIKAKILESGVPSVSKGKIILATVKGDIHDIGKNIVKVILENYGYTVIDLGRDVDPQIIVDSAINEDIKLVGLSALMTTTLPSMEETISALHKSGHDCRIMVGGAVLTGEYAEKIGADFYAKDAAESVEIARKIFG